VSIVDMMRIRLSEHELIEEEHFWPAVRKVFEDGDAIADRALAQEQEGKDLLQELDGLSGDDERFDELVEKLVLALRTHVAYESDVFLEFKQATSEEDRAKLGRRMQRSARLAPTRPHPHAPDRPPFNRIAAAAAAPLDRARDALASRPAEREGKPEEQEQTPPEEVVRRQEEEPG
jgi:hypothetical protein